MPDHLEKNPEDSTPAITDHLQTYLQDTAPVIGDDYRDLQRTALGEVLKLSTDAIGPVVLQIESRYQTAQKTARTKFEESEKEIKSRFQAESQEAQRQYQDHLAKIQSEYESELDTLETDTKVQRDRISSSAETHEQEAQKNCAYEMMLAETVADGASKKYLQERKEIEAAIPAAKRRLSSLSEQAEAVLRRYRYSIGPARENLEPSDSEMYDPVGTFRKNRQLAQQYLDTLSSLRVPSLFTGAWPLALSALPCGIAVGLMGLISYLNVLNLPSFYITAPVAFLVTLAVILLLGKKLWTKGRSQISTVYEPFRMIISNTQQVLDRHLKLTLEQLDRDTRQASEKHSSEEQKAKEQFDTIKGSVARRREASLGQIEDTYKSARQRLDQGRDHDRRQTQQAYQDRQQGLQIEYDQNLLAIQNRYRQETADCQNWYESLRGPLEKRWQQGLSCIEALLEKTAHLDGSLSIDFSDPSWRQWSGVNTFTSIIRFGYFHLDMSQLADSLLEQADSKLDRTEPVLLPALLAFPDRCSVLLETRNQGREDAIKTLRAVMVRLFTSLVPGRVHFTIIDPIGLGENFAGFMHASDYEEMLVGRRIWTDAAQIQQRLEDLTEHMEKVIQKYLRNEFKTIEDYNQQAGELAEPYRFLVISDFPTNFNEESARRLSSIINSGARCGVYTLIAYDARRELPPGIHIEDLASNSVHLSYENNRFVWLDEIFRRFPLTTDSAPAEDVLTGIMHTVGRASKDSTRVEVPFETIIPNDDQYWSSDSSNELYVPIGKTGATRLQYLKLGRGVAQHMLIAGKTGSGKSTLLHVIITNLALWYSPDQVELYLIDFKKGVEFKTYVTNNLAHIRTVAIESDREFGLSILQRLDAELTRRGDLFRQAGVQDIASYRQITGTVMPRTVLIVDEFQVFFSEDDKLGQDAGLLLEQLVRQGRAFGVHVLLGSQTLGGTSGLARSTLGQMAVRIAMQCSEADSQLILDDDNVAARLLSRPGEAIYNDTGGMVVGNSPFQTSWLPDQSRDEYLRRIAELSGKRSARREPLIVFEGNVPADITGNRRLTECLEQSHWPGPTVTGCAWLGEPVAIKEPTSVVFRRQSGSNLLVIGQRDVSALGLLSAAMVSLAAQHDPQSARFVILDGSPTDSPHAGQLQRVASALPHEHRIVEWRGVADVIADLARQVQSRQQSDLLDAPAIYVLIYALQRYRVLRRNEDDFGFSTDQQDSPRPDKQFAELLREGPPVGVHLLVWSDTLATIERTLDRQTIREFDNRVLFQMSSSDSSNLIDSPVANKLGLHRALFYSEERGDLEKFRPYAPMSPKWLDHISNLLKIKSTEHDSK